VKPLGDGHRCPLNPAYPTTPLPKSRLGRLKTLGLLVFKSCTITFEAKRPTKLLKLGAFNMYSDPARIRNNVTKVRLSDEEEALVNAYVEKNGGQKAVMIRELIIEQISIELNSDDTPARKIM
jgi:hypothetical protein